MFLQKSLTYFSIKRFHISPLCDSTSASLLCHSEKRSSFRLIFLSDIHIHSRRLFSARRFYSTCWCFSFLFTSLRPASLLNQKTLVWIFRIFHIKLHGFKILRQLKNKELNLWPERRLKSSAWLKIWWQKWKKSGRRTHQHQRRGRNSVFYLTSPVPEQEHSLYSERTDFSFRDDDKSLQTLLVGNLKHTGHWWLQYSWTITHKNMTEFHLLMFLSAVEPG